MTKAVREFIEGIATLAQLQPRTRPVPPPQLDTSGLNADARAMAADWSRVGMDLNHAIRSEREPGTDRSPQLALFQQ